MTIERGTLLNKRYRIVDILGQGGMASVYRAIDENLGVEVAVKENLFTTEEYARQFRLEAVILASLRHPNLPRVTDHFVISGQGQYLVMDYIEGEDLRQRMDRLSTLPEEEVIVIGVAMCEALTYLHTRTPPVLHRDIKPGNVKIDPQGQIFLVDFGLAKVVHDGRATTTGARAMTPGYSPPEQYGTARTDHRSDIYSLGATLYSALTDTLPEDGLARAMEQESMTSIRQHNTRVSRRLAAVIEKALEVRPEDRYQSAEEFRRCLLGARSTTHRKAPVELILEPPPDWALHTEHEDPDFRDEDVDDAEGYLEDNQGMLLPVSIKSSKANSLKPFASSRKRAARQKFLMALFLLALLVTFGSIVASSNGILPALSLLGGEMFPPTSPTETYQVIESLVTQELPKEPTGLTTAAVGPLPAQTTTVTPTKTPTRAATRALTPTLTVTPLLSPTPQGGGAAQIAFASDRSGNPEIWLMNIDGSGLRRLTEIPEGACQPSWSPDGSKLVFISPCKSNTETYRGSSLFVINADGSELTPLSSMPGGDYDPAWSPDGRYIAFTSLRYKNIPQVHILDLEKQTVEPLLDPDERPNSQPTWSPDSKELAYLGPRNQIWTMAVDGSNRNIISRPSDYVNRLPHWSPSGNTIVFTQSSEGMGGAPWLATVSAEVGSLSAVVARDVAMSEANFSPDGFWLTFTSWPDGPNRDIFIMTGNGVGRQRLTQDAGNNFDPAWRPGTLP